MNRILLFLACLFVSAATAQTTLAPGASVTITCAAPGVPAPPDTPPVITPTPPVTPGCVPRAIPWAQYLSEGCDGVCVQTIKGWFGITACEWEQAYAAGYPRPAPSGGGGGGSLSGFDLTGSEGGGLKRNTFQSGTFSFTAARSAGAYWHFEVNPGPNTATQVSINGAPFQELRESTKIEFRATAGQTYRVSWAMNGQATIGTIVRYSE